MGGFLQGSKLIGEGWAEQLNPCGHGLNSAGWQHVPMCWNETWHKLCFYSGDMDVGGMLICLAHLDQAMYVCFSATKAPKQ